jgi:hypothetical protein
MSSNETTNVNSLTETDVALMRAYIHLRSGIQSGQEQVSAPYHPTIQEEHDFVAEHATTSMQLSDEEPRS